MFAISDRQTPCPKKIRQTSKTDCGKKAEGDFCGLCFWNNNVAFSSLACIPPTFSSLFIFLHSYLTKNTISFTGRPSRPLCRIALGSCSRLSPFAMACPLYSLFCQKLYFISLTVNYLASDLASPWTRHPHFTRSPSKCVCDVSPCCNPCAPPCFPACFSVLYSYITNSNVGRLRHVPCFFVRVLPAPSSTWNIHVLHAMPVRLPVWLHVLVYCIHL